MSESRIFRTLLAKAKRADHSGDYVGAFHFLAMARRRAQTGDEWHKNPIGITDHRHAVLEAKHGSIKDARDMFELSISEIGPDAPVERAHALRDFGKLEHLAGNDLLAREKLNEAIALLEDADSTLEHLDEHLTITRGFLAQVDIAVNRDDALQRLRDTAAALLGSKPEYELDPIACLIENLPVGVERQLYILRAIYLSLRLGNQAQAIEYMTLLGGKPLRSVYRHIF
jgi:hypothetical protein